MWVGLSLHKDYYNWLLSAVGDTNRKRNFSLTLHTPSQPKNLLTNGFEILPKQSRSN